MSTINGGVIDVRSGDPRSPRVCDGLIDVHSHFFPLEVLDVLRKEGARYRTPVRTEFLGLHRDDGGRTS